MVKAVGAKLANSAHDLIFRNIHHRRLIYNSCWEDPRIDRQLLRLSEDSKVVMITSGGCNVLDYLLDSPAEIHTVDMNPRQNALLHLKLGLIRQGNFDDLFTMFGIGSHQLHEAVYTQVRHHLPTYAQNFWDHKIGFFDRKGVKKSFYYHGASGDVAWLLRQFLQANKKIKIHLYDLLDTQHLAEQRDIYLKIEPELWNTLICWLLKHPVVMALLGVPRAQMQLVREQYTNGLPGYIKACLRHVLTEVLMQENYFWRVYITGFYTESCCPNYLKKASLKLLQRNLERVHTYNCTLTDFLKCHAGAYSHYILLDHQDWLAWHAPDALQEEWQFILNNSQAGTKIVMRSASRMLDFLPDPIKSALRFFPETTALLSQQDRVGTYSSLHLAEVL